MAKIYWAASLHSEEVRKANETLARVLEAVGHEVLLPQRHGIWEPMVQDLMVQEPFLTYERALKRVKTHCFEMDMLDVIAADVCVLHCPKVPSEGSVFEFGYCKGKVGGCLCLVYCPDDEVYDEINLMVTYGAPRCRTLDEVISFIDSEV
jgi:nucleoside 2-deoxyribosyltransferase